MRRGRESKFIEEDGVLLGVSLGADYCAEHEWGIDKLKEAFGLPEDITHKKPFAKMRSLIGLTPVLGVKKRQVTILPEGLVFLEMQGGKWCLMFAPWRDSLPEETRDLHPEMWWDKEQGIIAGWSDDDFAIVVDEAGREKLETIFNAFVAKDIIIGLFGGGVFENAGLSFFIASRLPESVKKEMYDADKDYYDLLVAAEKTGIQKRLEDAGLEWFALSPKWAKDGFHGIADRTKYDVIFWLNPVNQSKYNSGWFTVEELDEWAAGKGKVLKEV